MSSLNLAAAMVVGLFAAPPDSAPVAAETQIRRWIQDAMERHPESRSAGFQTQAARSEIGAATAWMPPETQLLYKSDKTVDLSMTQMIPGFGKTGSQTKIREAKLDMARSDSADRMRKLALAIRETAWMEWMALEKSRILVQQESLAIRLSESVRRAQSQGMSTASEAWLAQAKARQIRLESEKAKSEAAAATAMREAWTGPGTNIAASAPSSPDWTDSVVAVSAATRSDIVAMERDAAMQMAMAESMRASLHPDYMVGAMVMRMSNGMPGWGVMAGLTLPFVPWSSGMASGEAAGAHSRSRGTQSRVQSMRRMAHAEVVDHSNKARTAWRALRELDSLILPGQENAIADARSRYAQGREMLSMVLAMQDMELMARMERLMRRGEYELERARLLAAAGLESFEQAGAR
jgi:outer membrane protein TolC